MACMGCSVGLAQICDTPRQVAARAEWVGGKTSLLDYNFLKRNSKWDLFLKYTCKPPKLNMILDHYFVCTKKESLESSTSTEI